MYIHTFGSETRNVADGVEFLSVTIGFSDFLGFGLRKYRKLAQRYELNLTVVKSSGKIFQEHELKFEGSSLAVATINAEIQCIRFDQSIEKLNRYKTNRYNWEP